MVVTVRAVCSCFPPAMLDTAGWPYTSMCRVCSAATVYPVRSFARCQERSQELSVALLPQCNHRHMTRVTPTQTV